MFALLATCDFSLKLEQPSLELDFEAAISSGDAIEISYKFVTDEPVLRCHYSIRAGEEEVFSNTSGLLTPGILYTETINLPEPCVDGDYLLKLSGQVERSGTFVDMASLSQTAEFSIDSIPPESPDIDMLEGGCYLPTDTILINHPEWASPTGTPVKLRYNFDAGPFEAGAVELSQQGGGISIAFPPAVVAAGLHTLQVTAIDEAGNELLAPVSRSFMFLRITKIENLNLPPAENRDYAHIVEAPQSLRITGYTFNSTDLIELVDADGTRAREFGSPSITENQIQITYILQDETEPNYIIKPGPGYFRVITATSSTTIPFTFVSAGN